MSDSFPDKSRRQVVFDWLMDDEGYWGGSEEVEQVDALLAALDAHSSAIGETVWMETWGDVRQVAWVDNQARYIGQIVNGKKYITTVPKFRLSDGSAA